METAFGANPKTHHDDDTTRPEHKTNCSWLILVPCLVVPSLEDPLL